MTKNEKRFVVDRITQVVFNFLDNQKHPDPELGPWTRRVLRQDLREIVNEVSEEFGILKTRLVMGARPEKDLLWISTLRVEGDEKTDSELTAQMKWPQFMEALLDSDMDELEWWERRFTSGAKQIRQHLKE